MKKATNKLMSFLAAFAMVIGVLVAPFVDAMAAPEAGTPVGPTADKETKATVTIHKIKVKSTTGFPIEQVEGATEIVGKDGTTKYDGGQITNIKGFFGGKDNENQAEELAKVTFTYWVFDDEQAYKDMLAEPSEFDTVEEVKAKLKAVKNVETDDVTTTTNGVAIPEITVPANGHKYVWAVEKSKTVTVKNEENEDEQQTITGGAAVPFGLALPLFKADGSVNTDVHVYPKNTTANEPKVDKDFEGEANAKQDRLEISGKDAPIVKDVKVGDEVPYDIETLIPEGAKYKTVAWTDQMTEGLTFNNDVKIMIGAKDSEKEWDKANYTVKKDGNGFVLELTEAGLKALEEKAKDAEVRLLVKYSATVNENAKVERPERNDVIFHYGNEPHHGNTPYPTKPNQETGELTVTKDFPGVEGGWVKGEEVEVTLIDAHTGKPAEDLPDGQTAKVTLKIDKKTHTWKGLDKDKQYKVVETFKPGDEVTYVKQNDGSVKIEDRITDNPTPLNPEEPAVKTYGHRFQKIDQSEGKGLEGAKFVVKNNNEGEDKGKVLAQKSAKDLEADQKAYDEAEKAYKDEVAKLTVKGEEITYPEGVTEKTIAEKKATRDAAYVKVNTQWTWIDDTDKHEGAYVFTSKANGYFKVTGLNLGKYQLIETKAPDGYAENKTPQDFEVTKNSTGDTTKLESGELEDKEGFKQIENKKVTIPQTGGIGSLIFIVAGLALMGVAFVAMKRRNSYEEA